MAVSEDQASCWVHIDLTVTKKENSGVLDSSKGVGQKNRMPSTSHRYRAGMLDRHRDWQTMTLRFPRQNHSG